MARIAVVRSGAGNHLLYSVDSAVGPGAPNKKEDVLLVQYFLRESFKGNEAFKSEPFPGGVLVVDGFPGPKTFAAIQHFQKVQKKAGIPLATDGRVDPPVGTQVVGSISRTQYTIINLNQGYKITRPQDWPRVSQATDCPPELRDPLKEPKFL